MPPTQVMRGEDGEKGKQAGQQGMREEDGSKTQRRGGWYRQIDRRREGGVSAGVTLKFRSLMKKKSLISEHLRGGGFLKSLPMKVTYYLFP